MFLNRKYTQITMNKKNNAQCISRCYKKKKESKLLHLLINLTFPHIFISIYHLLASLYVQIPPLYG